MTASDDRNGLIPSHRAEAKTRALQLLGLAVRARKVVLGGDTVIDSIRASRAKLVLVATDAGANMAKKHRDKCAFYHIPHYQAFSSAELGMACGKAKTVAVALTDPGFATKMQEYIGEFSGGEAFGETSGI